MVILTLFFTIPFGENFGFNFNILETNLINLVVVIGVVVSFGGNALQSLLNNRKQIILNNLDEANTKAKQAQEKLSKAKTRLETAKAKATEIRNQGQKTAQQEKNQCIDQTTQDVLRLETVKKETIQFQQQKTITQISQQVVSLAVNKVREKLTNKLNSDFHSSVNNFNIVLFTNYKFTS